MKNCEMTLTSRSVVPTSNLVPAGVDPTKLSDKEKQLLNSLTTKEKERLGLSNAVGASSDSKPPTPAGKDGGFVRAAPGHSSTALGSDASTPKLGQHRAPNNSPNTAHESIPTSSSTEHSTDPVSAVEEKRAPNPLLDQIQAKKLKTTQLPAKSMTNNASSTATDIPAAPPPPANDENSATSQPLTQPTPHGNLLAQIQGGKALKKVDNNVPHPNSKETHQDDNSNTVQSAISKAISQRRGAIAGKIESKEPPKTDDDDWK
jgi:WH2 motif